MLKRIPKGQLPQPAVLLDDFARTLFSVRVSDSNRWAPGCGHLDFAEVSGTLQAMRYSGYVSVKCLPEPDSQSCPRIAIATLRKAVARKQ